MTEKPVLIPKPNEIFFKETVINKSRFLAYCKNVDDVSQATDFLAQIKNILEKENPKRILEIGTAVGYSASMFAKYAPNAIIDTIELNEERYNEAKINVQKIGV